MTIRVSILAVATLLFALSSRARRRAGGRAAGLRRGRPGENGEARRRARAGLRARDRHLLQRRRGGTAPSARRGVRNRDGGCMPRIQRMTRRRRSMRWPAGERGRLVVGSHVRAAEEGSGAARRGRGRAPAAPGHRALLDPRLRRAGVGAPGAAGGARLREDRARRAARALHAVAHLHAPLALQAHGRLRVGLA